MPTDTDPPQPLFFDIQFGIIFELKKECENTIESNNERYDAGNYGKEPDRSMHMRTKKQNKTTGKHKKYKKIKCGHENLLFNFEM